MTRNRGDAELAALWWRRFEVRISLRRTIAFDAAFATVQYTSLSSRAWQVSDVTYKHAGRLSSEVWAEFELCRPGDRDANVADVQVTQRLHQSGLPAEFEMRKSTLAKILGHCGLLDWQRSHSSHVYGVREAERVWRRLVGVCGFGRTTWYAREDASLSSESAMSECECPATISSIRSARKNLI